MYIMYAFMEVDYSLGYHTVGVFRTFKEFLRSYPDMKKFYGDALRCDYLPGNVSICDYPVVGDDDYYV